GLTAVFEIRAASLSLQRDLRAMVLAFTPDEKAKLRDSQAATEAYFGKELAALDAVLDADGEERQVFEQLKKAQDAWAIERATVTESALSGDQLTSRTTLNGEENRKVVDDLNAQISRMVELKQARMASVVSARDASFEMARAMLIGAIV